ncbi:MAG: histidine phosphatase family protein [Clostridium sp.]|nr:histidine phosphatase family protein [Clostridium sp.]
MCNISKGKVTVYLMRHGQTIINRAGRIQGWCDGVLTKDGIDAAVDTGYGLRDTVFKSVYSSDLGRAIKTANIVIKENKNSKDLKLNEVEDLREVYFGKYEGEHENILFQDILNYLNVKNIKEAEEKYEFQRAYCDSAAALDETNEAEDYNTALNRVLKGLDDICIENEEEDDVNILLVIHGGILRLIIDHFDKTFNIRDIDNAGISTLVYDNGNYTVKSVNDMSYNEKGRAMRLGKDKMNFIIRQLKY